MDPDVLASFPYVVVRIGCDACKRIGSYRLARLAAKYGAEIRMDDLLDRLAGDCPDWRPRHPYRPGCKARFVDLYQEPPRPPDLPAALLPPRGLRVVGGGRE